MISVTLQPLTADDREVFIRNNSGFFLSLEPQSTKKEPPRRILRSGSQICHLEKMISS